MAIPTQYSLQLASIVYERAPIAIHRTLEEVTAGHKSSPPKTPDLHRSAASSAARRAANRPPNADPNSPVHSPSPGEDQTKESAPGKLVGDIWGHDSIIASKIEEAFEKANQGPGRSTIGRFCEDKDIDYEPVSELNNSSSVCSTFSFMSLEALEQRNGD